MTLTKFRPEKLKDNRNKLQQNETRWHFIIRQLLWSEFCQTIL